MKLLKFLKICTNLTLKLITELVKTILIKVLCINHNEIYKYIFALFYL